MVRALMVDVDGVLIDSRPSGTRSWGEDIEARLGLDMIAFRREFFARYWEEILVGRLDLLPCMTEALDRTAPHLRCEDVIGYWFALDANVDEALRSALEECRAAGLQVYLATNNEHLRARHLMEVVGFSRLVDGIFYSAALGCRKPQREFFAAAAAGAGLPPEELLLIDDRAENVTAAREAGWKAWHWTPGMTLSAVLAQHRPDLPLP